MANTIAQMIPLWGLNAYIYLYGIIIIAAVLIVVIFGPKTLLREPIPNKKPEIVH